ncbi:glycoside hydrolase family protein [Bacteroides acidifaciens]|uniref:glycoside hydrolase family protein n=1 Tax=Bacteroides acidifaciens TaxID=85831 RepID=UPI002598B653|nr:glycoside hydrolase [Bacteroides acidifaciens]
MRIIVTAICLILACSGMVAQPRGGGSPPPAALQIPASLFEKAVACIKEHEGWHGNHLPYVGYGHKLLPGETFTPDMSEEQADSLLRADLMKLCRMCSRFGKDALLVATLSYNVGYYRLVGYGKIPKSRLIQKLEAGDRDIYNEYISFRCYKGKVVPSIERRRKKEFRLLYMP